MSNTPTSSAQVAEGLSMEAERAEFESVMLSQFGEGETFKRDKYGCYMNRSWHDAFIGWRAARRTAATGADSLPPLPPIDEHWMTNDHTYTAEQMHAYARQVVAPYAERIRLLERELAERR